MALSPKLRADGHRPGRPVRARSPRGLTLWRLPEAGWPGTLKRAWQRMNDDNLSIVAAGVSFYAFLAFIPMLGVLVFAYGLIASPAAVVHDITRLTLAMPADAARLIGQQIHAVVTTSSGKKRAALALAALLALVSARSAAGAIITALNIAYEQKERRSFIRVTLLALGITAGAAVVAVLGAAVVGMAAQLHVILPGTSRASDALLAVAGHAVVFAFGTLGAAVLYRFGPAHRHIGGLWPTPGAVMTGAFWLGLNLLFGLYVHRLGNFNATYGSLSAVVGLLTWLYLSSYILLVGAELDAVLEPEPPAQPRAAPVAAA